MLNGTSISIKGIIAILGTVLIGLLGGWDTILEVLFLLAVLDVAMGILAAAVGRDLSSREMWRGGLRKVGMFAVVALAAQLDRVIPLGSMFLNTEAPILRTATVWFFIAQEGLSILENAALAGIPIPATLRGFLREIQQREEEAGKGDGAAEGQG